MLHLLTEPAQFHSKKKKYLYVRSESWESLLVDWLTEILYYFTVKKIGFSRFKIKKIAPFALAAFGYGETIRPEQHSVFHEVKAVTYHDLKIKKRKGSYSTRIIFDL